MKEEMKIQLTLEVGEYLVKNNIRNQESVLAIFIATAEAIDFRESTLWGKEESVEYREVSAHIHGLIKALELIGLSNGQLKEILLSIKSLFPHWDI